MSASDTCSCDTPRELAHPEIAAIISTTAMFLM
jgi:hypothetical protein